MKRTIVKSAIHNKFRYIFFVLILVYSLSIWWPTKTLPYYWDGAMYINTASQAMIANTFNTLVPPFQDFAHPPLFWLSHSLLISIFGDSPFVAHLLILPFLPIYLLLTYFLAKEIVGDTFHASAATVLVALTPFVIVEYGQIYLDLPVATLILGTVLAQYRNRTRTAAIILSFAVLTKLTAFLIVPLLFSVLWWNSKGKWRETNARWYLLPIVCASIWLVYHHSVTGWWLVSPNRTSYVSSHLGVFLDYFREASSGLLIDQMRWIPFVLGGVLFIKYFKKLKKNRLIIFLAAVVLVYLGFYAFTGEINYRYFLPIYPLFIILVIKIMHESKVKPAISLVGLAILSALFILKWYPRTVGLDHYLIRPFEDLRYQDIINLGQQTSQFVEANYSDALVYGTYPESYQLAQPFQGYTQKVIAFDFCHYYKPTIGKKVLVFHHLYSPLQPACAELLNKTPHALIQRFEKNGLEVNVYLLSEES